VFAASGGECDPKRFNPGYWRLLHEPTGSVVLGDACAFAVSEDGQCGLLPKLGTSWREVYIPISSKTVLVACKEDRTPSLDLAQINQASAKLASSYVYASRLGDEVNALVPLIGTEPVLSHSEISDIMENSGRR
jgi:hypothetical protein